MNAINKNWQLFKTFFIIGITTFGGGLAMLPMLEQKLVDENQWINRDELMDFYAIAQCTPGIIAINVATMVGKKQNKLFGAIFATLGMIAPSILIITIIACSMRDFMQNQYIHKFLSGIKIGAAALIILSLTKLYKKNIQDFKALVLMLVSFIAVLTKILSPITILLLIVGCVIITARWQDE